MFFLQKRREQNQESLSVGLDDTDMELLEQNKVEREKMGEEIDELRERSVSTPSLLSSSFFPVEHPTESFSSTPGSNLVSLGGINDYGSRCLPGQ